VAGSQIPVSKDRVKDSAPFAVVDLFAGPGGLGEGFAECRSGSGTPRFRTVLSVENDRHAYETLRLRAFLRKFGDGFPDEYYRFLNGHSGEPNWDELAPDKWREATDETRCLELGNGEESDFLDERIEQIRSDWGDRTVLIGGPPCQAYSVVGRVRNHGKPRYDPDKDDRNLLYREYIDVLSKLRPAVAVMENVKGLLSASLGDRRVFPLVLTSLRFPRNDTTYRTYALCPRSGNASLLDDNSDPADFVVRAEEHGIPQKRHRVFVVCVRDDIAETLPDALLPRLDRQDSRVSVADILDAMPKLRSRLSAGDSPRAWRNAVLGAGRELGGIVPSTVPEENRRYRSVVADALKVLKAAPPPASGAAGSVAIPETCPEDLRNWIFDERVEKLPNNETRGHMAADLTRYFFAAAYAAACGRSPKTRDFPAALAAEHRNWSSGSFDDRFRVQVSGSPATTVTSHLAKDGHYFIHPDPAQVRSLTVREAARVQTFRDNYLFCGPRTSQYVQVGNAVPPYLAWQIANSVWKVLEHHENRARSRSAARSPGRSRAREPLPLAAAATFAAR